MEATMLQKPKLRTYATFKHSFGTEKYVNQTLSRSRRSFLSQLRLGVLPLQIETVIFKPICGTKNNRKIYPSKRICTSCNINVCEDDLPKIYMGEITINRYPILTILIFLICQSLKDLFI